MAQSCLVTSWLIVSCGGVGSRAPWRLWDNGGRHDWWVRGLASFHLVTLHVRCPPSIKSCQCRVFLIPRWTLVVKNLVLAFMDKTKGHKCTTKEP
jgi:hypothetical protein